MCNNCGDTNKGYYLTPDTYIGIVYLPDNPAYLVRGVTTPWTHPLWYDDLHWYHAYVCFPLKEDSYVCPSLIFS